MAVRRVLISPHAFGDFYPAGESLVVNLTRKQIENSPPIDAHKPISRQYEDEYYRYYGWPSYRGRIELWGGAGFPIVPPSDYAGNSTMHGVIHSENSDDSHLRSTRSVHGYHIQTAEGEIGHVTDFMIDDKSWAIRHLVVETGHWFHGKEIVISPAHIERISYEKSKVFVSVTKGAIQDAAQYQMPRAVYRGVHE
jgi:sporulation protein YlmC with PRC-barrel domain